MSFPGANFPKQVIQVFLKRLMSVCIFLSYTRLEANAVAGHFSLSHHLLKILAGDAWPGWENRPILPTPQPVSNPILARHLTTPRRAR